ncbi:hypothetical protein BCR44DRAFT_1466853 [Catenaria anguillulae PL171]|uniref:General transcription and DNA repair factor IIH subunit TFB5 n=1 Tax=Catenaria anguillulae PL171 TaxID=765915 RepID=A0A1Y2H4D3_9FUNG|nr:hypothetical protein BCR44DRAFT_1466853 [Catenaria anguillulae PL171]
MSVPLRATLAPAGRPSQPPSSSLQPPKGPTSTLVNFKGRLLECSDPVVRDLILMYEQQRKAKGLEGIIVYEKVGDRHLFVRDDEAALRGVEEFVRKTLEDSRKLNHDSKPKPAFFRRKKGGG